MKALLAVLAIALAAQAQQTGAPPPAASDEEVFQVGQGVTAPKVLRQVQPEHPAKGFRISGVVLIGMVVSSTGEPKEVHVVKSLDKDIDQSAVDAVMKWRFDPAKKDGKPVAVRVSVEIRFHDM
jgi:periplasmic protein TonB